VDDADDRTHQVGNDFIYKFVTCGHRDLSIDSVGGKQASAGG